MCKHYYQNKSCQGESRTENHWHSRRKCYRCVTKKVPLVWQTQHFVRTTSVMRGRSITTTIFFCLTLLEPSGFGDFRKKNSSFQLPFQHPSSSAHCARELFSGSNGSTSLVDRTRKKIFAWGVWFFCEWHHKWRTFWPPWPIFPGPGRQPLGGSISLKFLLETRLQSESFYTLDDLLRFRVQKLWCKLVKIFVMYVSKKKIS